MNNILSYLDNQINIFKQKNGDYLSKIIMNKETKNKIFAELENDVDTSLCWADKKDNYRGISIEINNIDFLKLE